MIKLLKSSKFTLPKVYFVSKRSEICDIPVGVPFIVADVKSEKYLIRMLEYEVLWLECKKLGYPFDFKKILKDNGYLDIHDFSFAGSVYMEFTTEGLCLDEYFEVVVEELYDITAERDVFKEFVKDSSVYVDLEKLKSLNVFPIWLDTIEKAITTNIHNFAVFNSNMYNKKLEGMYGSLELTSPNRNIIIIDISSSIPKAVSTTCLTLAKNLAESFYADLLITGSKSTLYTYEDIYKLDIERVYTENGMDNDQVYFKKLVSEKKVYKTAIVFGDNDSPCNDWSNSYNRSSKEISKEDGKKLCKWEIDHLISLHTKGIEHLAAYADWFTFKTEERIKDWVIYFK